MSNIIFALSTSMGLFLFLFICVILGRQFGKWQISHHVQRKIKVFSVAEGAVFALLGLLIAFTFSGAHDRFEARKMYIIEEVNAIETAYLRVGLLEPSSRAALYEGIRQYVDSRIEIYKSLSDIYTPPDLMNRYQQLRFLVWTQSLAACQKTSNQAATLLFIPAINNMLEVANTRFAITRIHPPLVIFGLLIALAALSSFLAGYSTVGSKGWNFVYILSYIFIITLTIYIIIDLEFPRFGLIKVNRFDQLLVEMRKDLN